MVLREAPCPSTRLTLAASIIYKKTHLHEPTTPPPISRGAGTIGGCGGAIDCADAFAVGQQLQSACVPHAGRRAPANDVTLSPVRHDAWASRIAVSALLAVHAHVAKDAREKSRTLSQSNCVPPYPPRSVSESHVTKSCRTISVRDSFQCVRILTSASMACCLRVKQTSGKLSLTRLPGRQSKRTRRTPAVVRRGSAAPRTAQTLATMTAAASGQASDTASGNDPPGTHHSSSRSSLRKRRSHRRRGTSRRHSQHLPHMTIAQRAHPTIMWCFVRRALCERTYLSRLRFGNHRCSQCPSALGSAREPAQRWARLIVTGRPMVRALSSRRETRSR